MFGTRFFKMAVKPYQSTNQENRHDCQSTEDKLFHLPSMTKSLTLRKHRHARCSHLSASAPGRFLSYALKNKPTPTLSEIGEASGDKAV